MENISEWRLNVSWTAMVHDHCLFELPHLYKLSVINSSLSECNSGSYCSLASSLK